MEPILVTDSGTELIRKANANLQEMGSLVELTDSISATQLVDALNAEFYGIDGVGTLSVDDSAETFCTKLNSNFSLAGQGVKEQYEAEVADTVSKVNALLDNDDNTLPFILCTDVHYNPTEYVTEATGFTVGLEKVFDDSANNMRAVVKDVNVDSLLCIGDIIDGNISTFRSTEEAAHMIAKLQSVGLPLYIALGNHDNNRDGNSDYPVFSRSQMKTMFMDYVADDVTFANESYKSDYYKDFGAKSLRVIVIYGNSGTNGDYLYNNETRTFLQSSLSNLPYGYKAIVMTHVPPCTKMNYNNAVRPGGENIPSGESTPSVKDIVKNAGGKVIAMFYGHCHQDNVWADPFVSIGTCCNKASFLNGKLDRNSEDSWMPSRALDDETADLWDVVVINTDTKCINMVRFGAGADRIIHYEPIECAAGLSVALTPTAASGGNWGARTSDASKASVNNGVVTVGSNIKSGTLLSVWYTDRDPEDVSAKTWGDGGTYMEFWTIKVS